MPTPVYRRFPRLHTGITRRDITTHHTAHVNNPVSQSFTETLPRITRVGNSKRYLNGRIAKAPWDHSGKRDRGMVAPPNSIVINLISTERDQTLSAQKATS